MPLLYRAKNRDFTMDPCVAPTAFAMAVAPIVVPFDAGTIDARLSPAAVVIVDAPRHSFSLLARISDLALNSALHA